MAPEPLTEQETDEALAELSGWAVDAGRLTRGYSFPKHLPAAAMVIHIAAVQEELGHHADLTLSYNTLGVAVNTHSVGGKITELDVALARRIEALAPTHGAS